MWCARKVCQRSGRWWRRGRSLLVTNTICWPYFFLPRYLADRHEGTESCWVEWFDEATTELKFTQRQTETLDSLEKDTRTASTFPIEFLPNRVDIEFPLCMGTRCQKPLFGEILSHHTLVSFLDTCVTFFVLVIFA